MWIRVRAFSRNTMSIPLGILYSLNRFSCILASWAKAKDVCSKPTSSNVKTGLIRSADATFEGEKQVGYRFLTVKCQILR